MCSQSMPGLRYRVTVAEVGPGWKTASTSPRQSAGADVVEMHFHPGRRGADLKRAAKHDVEIQVRVALVDDDLAEGEICWASP